MKHIKPKHARFCEEYMRDANAAAAYRRAGYASKNADVNACRLMKRSDVAAHLAMLQDKLEVAVMFSVQDLVNRLGDIAFADHDELVELLVLPCKYCAPDKPCVEASPDPSCPECDGLGRYRIVYRDTRHLSHQGRALFAGVKSTKYGPQVVAHDRMKALHLLVRLLMGR